MKMQSLESSQAAAFLDSASYLEPTLNMGEKAIHYGVDSIGREFILIASMASDVAKLGYF